MKYVGLFAACAVLILFQFSLSRGDARFVADAQEVQESAGEKGEKAEKKEKEIPGGEEGEFGQDGQNGQEGTDGESVEEPTQEEADVLASEDQAEEERGGKEQTVQEPEKGEAQIATGDASSTAEISATGNRNTTKSGEETAEEESFDDVQGEELRLCEEKEKSHGKATKGTKEEPGQEGEKYCREVEEVEVEVENENDIVAENEAKVEADTGVNTANDNPGNASVDTGDATAIADVFNVVNMNAVESSGLFVLLSSLREHFFDIDLREWAEYFEDDEPVCSKTTCITFKELEALSRNNATISNDIMVRAQTGQNEANNNAGNADINTGDAYAAANVVNIANTNIINSNYLLFIANNFGSFVGDIVFPTASSFFTSLFAGSTPSYDITEIENRNDASIANSATSTSQTGKNEADRNKSSVIQTGDAKNATNVYNQINSNLVGGSSFVALVRVSGDWTGEVFGLPEGISWRRTAGGLVLYSDDMTSSFQDASVDSNSSSSESEDSEQGEAKGSKGEKGQKGEKIDENPTKLDVTNRNTAVITNNVEVVALTGENKVGGNGGEGTIRTGDAHAIANIVNIANTNVIGKNWLFAIFNILGDFGGNISFGRPDLWMGQRAEIPHDPVLPGDAITYYLTVLNNGDALATNITVKNAFPAALLDFGASDNSASVQESTISWELGTLNPGESRELAFTAILREDIPFGLSKFVNTSSVTAKESEENEEDNADTVELLAFRQEPVPPQEGGGGARGPASSAPRSTTSAASASNFSAGKAPNLHVEKTHGAQGKVQAGDAVHYTIVVTNTNGGSAQEAVLIDTLKTEAGELVHEEVWDLGEVLPDEEITITYTTEFTHQTGPGRYRNEARVEAVGVASNVASAEVLVEESPYMVLSEELQVAKAQLLSLEEQIRELEDQEQLFVLEGAVEEESSLAAFDGPGEDLPRTREIDEEKPFLASLAGLATEYGRGLAVFAASSLALLFFLLRRKMI